MLTKVGAFWPVINTPPTKRSLSVTDIEQVLGFAARVNAYENKVKVSWSFEVNGARCGIWDYKGSRWSVFDPENVLSDLFAEAISKANQEQRCCKARKAAPRCPRELRW